MTPTIREIVTEALAHELESFDLYTDLAEVAPTEGLRDFCSELAGQEKGHVEKIIAAISAEQTPEFQEALADALALLAAHEQGKSDEGQLDQPSSSRSLARALLISTQLAFTSSDGKALAPEAVAALSRKVLDAALVKETDSIARFERLERHAGDPRCRQLLSALRVSEQKHKDDLERRRRRLD